MATVAQASQAIERLMGRITPLKAQFEGHVEVAWRTITREWSGNTKEQLNWALEVLARLDRLYAARDRLQARIDETRLGAT